MSAHRILERHRDSRNPLWGLALLLRDCILSVSLLTKDPFILRRYRNTRDGKKRPWNIHNPPIEPVPTILEIRNDWDMNAGFFAQFLFVLQQLRFAQEHNLLPVVNMDQPYNYYRDGSRGENVWEYYFEPVSKLRSTDLESIAPELIGFVPTYMQPLLCIGDHSCPN